MTHYNIFIKVTGYDLYYIDKIVRKKRSYDPREYTKFSNLSLLTNGKFKI